MPENEFEKKVQQQLEELKLTPSVTVWPNVEKELRKKKKRRVVFFILLLAGLGFLGYSGYTLLGTQTDTAIAINKDVLGKPASHPSTIIPKQDTLTSPVDQPVSSASVAAPGKITTETNSQAITPTRIRKTQPQQQKKTEELLLSYTTPATGKTTVPQPVQAQEQIQATEIPVTPNTVTPSVTEQSATVVDSSGLTTAIPTDSSSTAKTDSVQDQPILAKKPQHSKIKWGLDFSAGTAFSRSSAFSLAANSQSADFYDSPLYSSVPNAGGPLSLVLPPSAVRRSPALKLGLAAEWQLSKRGSFSVGLRYMYLGEKIKTGAFKDTTILTNSYGSNQRSIRGIYPSRPQQSHTNNYHLVELPLLYQLQLNKGNKLPILWNGGLSAGYLLGTNALIYDTAARGVYYRNRNAFNRVQINLQTGLSFRFGNPASGQWSVGPEFSMGFSRLMKQDAVIRNRYLMYGGITARWLFPYKK